MYPLNVSYPLLLDINYMYVQYVSKLHGFEFLGYADMEIHKYILFTHLGTSTSMAISTIYAGTYIYIPFLFVLK
jgi:hypothetical protein